MGDASIDHARHAPTHTARFLMASIKPLAARGIGIEPDGAVALIVAIARRRFAACPYAAVLVQAPSSISLQIRFDGDGATAISAAGQQEGVLVATPA